MLKCHSHMPPPQTAKSRAETRTKLYVHNSIKTAVWDHKPDSLTTQPSSLQIMEREVQIAIILKSSKSRGWKIEVWLWIFFSRTQNKGPFQPWTVDLWKLTLTQPSDLKSFAYAYTVIILLNKWQEDVYYANKQTHFNIYHLYQDVWYQNP